MTTYRGYVHDTAEDVSDARTPTPEQARAIDLLELNPERRHAVRLTLAQWRHVDRVVATLRAHGVPDPTEPAAAIPTQRDGRRHT